jgi:hypothetical protein
MTYGITGSSRHLYTAVAGFSDKLDVIAHPFLVIRKSKAYPFLSLLCFPETRSLDCYHGFIRSFHRMRTLKTVTTTRSDPDIAKGGPNDSTVALAMVQQQFPVIDFRRTAARRITVSRID